MDYCAFCSCLPAPSGDKYPRLIGPVLIVRSTCSTHFYSGCKFGRVIEVLSASRRSDSFIGTLERIYSNHVSKLSQ